jgi:hypothetical protein
MVGDGGGARSMDALAEAFAYIEAHPEVQEVIVSGGDPLVMSTARIARLFERLAQIEHLTNVRLATRAPVTIPQRITDELVQALRKAHPSIWVMTHFNHPKELTAGVERRARAAGGRGAAGHEPDGAAARHQRPRRHARGALPRPGEASRAAVLPAADGPGARHGPPAHAARRGHRHHGRAAGPAERHRAPEAHRGHAQRAREGARGPRHRGGARPRAHHAAHLPRRAGGLPRPAERGWRYPRTGRSSRPSACRAKRSGVGPCTGSSSLQGQPPNCVLWKSM